VRSLLMAAGVAALAIPCAALAQPYERDMGAPPDIAAPPPATSAAPTAGNYSADIAYTGAPGDIGARETTIEQRIHHASASGVINRFQANFDFNRLAYIRKFEVDRARRDDGLNAVDRADIYRKLDDLDAQLNGQQAH
jgi:hypothetical protein